MGRTLSRMQQWSRLTGRHKLAVSVLLFWAVLTIRIFGSGDPLWIQAQTGNYSTFTISALGFAAALFGLTKWAEVQMAPPVSIPDAGVPG